MLVHQELTERIIGCGITVHRVFGPGLLESVYAPALRIELTEAGLSWRKEVPVPVYYKSRCITDYRADLIVEGVVLVEIKSVKRYEPVFGAQVLTYLKLTGLRVGLLMNFNTLVLKDGIKRFVL
jgi:GxxExxY protein